MIQTATTDQAEAICDVLIRSISILCVADHGRSTEIVDRWLANKTTRMCTQWINDLSAPLLVAMSNDQVAGVGKIDRQGYIQLCYVAPEAVRSGYGKGLVTAMEQLAAGWYLDRVTLESTRTALPFYISLGYRQTGVTKVFDTMDSYHMSKTLADDTDS